MAALPKSTLTPEEYLEIERAAEFRSEFYGGEMFAMSGGTSWHNLIVGNIAAELRARFRGGPCRVYTQDMRVQTDSTGQYTYPDVTAHCSPPQFKDRVRDTLLNPELIVEVLSDSTRPYDHGAKFIRYQGVASLTEYVLVSQHEAVVIRHNRQADGTWLMTFIHDLQATLDLRSIGVAIPLTEIYLNVEFPTPPAPASTADA